MIARSKENIFVLSIALITIAVRIAAIFIVDDLNDPEMWEFGMIARNMLNGEGFAFLALTQNVPSAFMPPGLPLIYYSVFKLIGDNTSSYLVILFFNSFLSGLTAVLSYNFAKELFNRNTALYTSLYVCFSPILIYSSILFNSIMIYQVLLLMVFIILNKISKSDTGGGIQNKPASKYVIYLSVVLGIFLYFRAESLFFILSVAVYFIFKKHFRYALLVIFISAIIISPWTIRNYLTFGKFILVTSSFGYNFYFGHGDEASTYIYKDRLSKIEENVYYEINQSEMAFDLAIEYMKANPVAELRESLRKIYSLWVMDIYRNEAKNPLYNIIWLPTLILFFIGTYYLFREKINWKSIAPMYLYLLFSTMLVVVFFNIPRYQIQMSIIVIPIAMYGMTSLISNFKSK